MINFELIRDQGILILSPDGPLEKADFDRLVSEIDPFIAANGRLNGLMIVAGAFPGWDSFGALVSHLRFVKDHHRKVARVAAVTDSEVLKIMPHIARHFVAAEIRQFAFDEKAEALAWLEASHTAA
ncbi:STAS/SEC14 domain-containing protein [Bradyrhizobium sp. SYSU BS000235]|uniref:STAS/SEC14 domain-containing protein n=1 Tax=Bradyrhizobium sp. SYSU BS000235 TaxID=3411332 RepID=UPI003C748E95